MTQPTCKTCRFWNARDRYTYDNTDGPTGGECLRHAPSLHSAGQLGGQTLFRQWPSTLSTEWCGDHESIVPEGAKPQDFVRLGHGGSDVTEPLDEADAVIGAIVALLVEKGVFTFQEYQTQVARALAIADQDHAEDIS